MIDHRVGSREEWVAERVSLLAAEKELTRRNEELAAFRRRMGWQTPFVSFAGSDFNYDFAVSFTDEQLLQGATYNFRAMPPVPAAELDQWPRDLPGASAFALEDGDIYHTYSSYARGGDALWSMYQWLDRAARGRNETPGWCRLHDEYDDSPIAN